MYETGELAELLGAGSTPESPTGPAAAAGAPMQIENRL
jgi:hypothetical protein